MDFQDSLNRLVLVKNTLKLRHSSFLNQQYHLLLRVFCDSNGLVVRNLQRRSRFAKGDKLKIVGFCDALLTIQNKFYAVKLAVVKSILCDMIIGLDVLSQHSTVSFHFGGKEDTVDFSVLAATLTHMFISQKEY